MPNQRAEGQKLINVPMKVHAIAEMDAAAVEMNYEDRSKFIRDAIREKLQRAGYKLPDELFDPPSRFGKGGRVHDEQSRVEEKPGVTVPRPVKNVNYGKLGRASSKSTSRRAASAAAGVAKGKTESQASGPKPPTGGPSGGKS